MFSFSEFKFTKDHSNVVKGMAILLLLFYHLFGNEYVVAVMEVNYHPLPLPLFLKLADFGNICVALFVFMTAYGISKKLFASESQDVLSAYKDASRRFFSLMGNFTALYISVNLLWWNRFSYSDTYGIGKQGLLNICLDALGLSLMSGTPTMNITWWYMKIAYVLIFLVPALAFLTKKVGYSVLLITLLLPQLLSIDADINRYLLTAVLGVCSAYGQWPEKIMCREIPKIFQWMAGIGGLITCVVIRQHPFIQENYLALIDAPVCLILFLFAGILLAGIPCLNRVLAFIGTHSFNIYLVHTFFYMILWQKFIYQFKYAGIILLLLLGVCLIYSLILEFLKNLPKKVVR